jgi:hypothetical protein
VDSLPDKIVFHLSGNICIDDIPRPPISS